MDGDFAFICDYAELAGKINALGIGFDTIYASSTPATHPLFHFIAQLRASVTEVGQKELELRLIDADGNDVIPTIKGPVNIAAPPAGTESVGRINVALRNVTFPNYGLYSLHLLTQGTQMVRIPLRVAPPPTTGSG